MIYKLIPIILHHPIVTDNIGKLLYNQSITNTD